jgi:hypothetical protein
MVNFSRILRDFFICHEVKSPMSEIVEVLEDLMEEDIFGQIVHLRNEMRRFILRKESLHAVDLRATHSEVEPSIGWGVDRWARRVDLKIRFHRRHECLKNNNRLELIFLFKYDKKLKSNEVILWN